jgi:predicted aspartyl protease
MPQWLFAAGAAATLASGSAVHVLDESDIPAIPVTADIIELQHERFRRLTVPVTIQGTGPYRFLIDTGAQATVISLQLADQLQLGNRGKATLVGMSSSRPVETVAISEVGLGNRIISVHTAPLVPLANIGGADGVLGLDTLQGQHVLLDFEQNRIALVDAEEARDDGYEIIVRARRKLGQLVIANARLNGIRIAVIVDTGAQGSIGNLALQERMRNRDRGTTELTDINGVTASGDIGIGKGLELGRARIESFPIIYHDAPPFRALGLHDQPAMVLGMQELRLFKRVAIDFDKRRVMFDMPDNSRRNRPSRWFGG